MIHDFIGAICFYPQCMLARRIALSKVSNMIAMSMSLFLIIRIPINALLILNWNKKGSAFGILYLFPSANFGSLKSVAGIFICNACIKHIFLEL